MNILNFAWTWQSCGHYLWCMKRPNIITWLSFSKGYRGGGSPVGWTKRVHKLLGLSCCSSLNFWLLIHYWIAFKFNIFYFLPLHNNFLIYCLSRALYRLRVLSLLQKQKSLESSLAADPKLDKCFSSEGRLLWLRCRDGIQPGPVLFQIKKKTFF